MRFGRCGSVVCKVVQIWQNSSGRMKLWIFVAAVVLVVTGFKGYNFLLWWINFEDWRFCDVQMILMTSNKTKLVERLSEFSEEEEEEPFLNLLDPVGGSQLVGNCSVLRDLKVGLLNLTGEGGEGTDCKQRRKDTSMGCVKIDGKIPTLKALTLRHEELSVGGYYKPRCISKEKVAILVPYRERKGQLRAFLHHMHPFLQHQSVEYQIFVIQQDNEKPFNRAMLFNIGFVEARKLMDFDCFIFHDIDLLPEDAQNLYNCPVSPRHMSVAIDKFCYTLPARRIFGGVTAMRKGHFLRVNGFSNSYWGWGGEDDDMYMRVVFEDLLIIRPSEETGRYKMIKHDPQSRNEKRLELLEKADVRFHSDGISSLKYKLKLLKLHKLFVLVSIQ